MEYGSYFTDLSTEFSDIDILLVYDEEKGEEKYGVDLVKVLGEIKEKSNLKNYVSPLIYKIQILLL